MGTCCKALKENICSGASSPPENYVDSVGLEGIKCLFCRQNIKVSSSANKAPFKKAFCDSCLGLLVQGTSTGCYTVNGEKLSRSNADPGRAIKVSAA